MVPDMSSCLNRKDPATRTSAPASTQVLAVASLMPPSTDTRREGLCSSAHCLAWEIFGTHSDMKDCPPKPGWTVMTRTMSTSGSHSSRRSMGVSGLMEMPAFRPLRWISAMAAWMSPSASMWTVIASHPASAKAPM